MLIHLYNTFSNNKSVIINYITYYHENLKEVWQVFYDINKLISKNLKSN